jgi:hypothetical protein
MTAVLPGTAGTVPQPTADPASPDHRAGSAGDGEARPGAGGVLSARLAEQGYVGARFGGMPVLVGPDLAAQLRASRQKQP